LRINHNEYNNKTSPSLYTLTVRCSTLRRVLLSAALYCTMHYRALRCSTVLRNAPPYSTVCYGKVRSAAVTLHTFTSLWFGVAIAAFPLRPTIPYLAGWQPLAGCQPRGPGGVELGRPIRRGSGGPKQPELF
jgi:hypothetical protein